MIELRKKKDFTAEVFTSSHERHHVFSYVVLHNYIDAS